MAKKRKPFRSVLDADGEADYQNDMFKQLVKLQRDSFSSFADKNWKWRESAKEAMKGEVYAPQINVVSGLSDSPLLMRHMLDKLMPEPVGFDTGEFACNLFTKGYLGEYGTNTFWTLFWAEPEIDLKKSHKKVTEKKLKTLARVIHAVSKDDNKEREARKAFTLLYSLAKGDRRPVPSRTPKNLVKWAKLIDNNSIIGDKLRVATAIAKIIPPKKDEEEQFLMELKDLGGFARKYSVRMVQYLNKKLKTKYYSKAEIDKLKSMTKKDDDKAKRFLANVIDLAENLDTINTGKRKELFKHSSGHHERITRRNTFQITRHEHGIIIPSTKDTPIIKFNIKPSQELSKKGSRQLISVSNFLKDLRNESTPPELVQFYDVFTRLPTDYGMHGLSEVINAERKGLAPPMALKAWGSSINYDVITTLSEESIANLMEKMEHEYRAYSHYKFKPDQVKKLNFDESGRYHPWEYNQGDFVGKHFDEAMDRLKSGKWYRNSANLAMHYRDIYELTYECLKKIHAQRFTSNIEVYAGGPPPSESAGPHELAGYYQKVYEYLTDSHLGAKKIPHHLKSEIDYITDMIEIGSVLVGPTKKEKLMLSSRFAERDPKTTPFLSRGFCECTAPTEPAKFVVKEGKGTSMFASQFDYLTDPGHEIIDVYEHKYAKHKRGWMLTDDDKLLDKDLNIVDSKGRKLGGKGVPKLKKSVKPIARAYVLLAKAGDRAIPIIDSLEVHDDFLRKHGGNLQVSEALFKTVSESVNKIFPGTKKILVSSKPSNKAAVRGFIKQVCGKLPKSVDIEKIGYKRKGYSNTFGDLAERSEHGTFVNEHFKRGHFYEYKLFR